VQPAIAANTLFYRDNFWPKLLRRVGKDGRCWVA
jgi:hypothetical protein